MIPWVRNKIIFLLLPLYIGCTGGGRRYFPKIDQNGTVLADTICIYIENTNVLSANRYQF